MGILAGAARDTHATHFPHRIANPYASLVSDLDFFLNFMRISNRILFLSLLIGFLILCVCTVVYFLVFQNPMGAASPPGIEPGDPEPTAPVQTTLIPAPATSIVTVQPALPERRRLTLEFPPYIRVGDADVVRLTLEVDDLGSLTPTAQIGGNVVSGEVVEIPNLYESHQVIAEARFDLAGMEVRPADLVGEALSPGNSVTFRWSVRPPDVGSYRGTIWLYLRFVNKQSGEESRKTVSAQIVEMEAVNFLGLSGEVARTAGVIGSVVGTILGFTFFEDMVKFALKRRNKIKP
jgi:hypothetical protein